MSTVKARFDGHVFVPSEPVNLPVGCELEIPLPLSPSKKDVSVAQLAELLEGFPENPQWPADGAAQHDHYLFGTPKKP